MFSYAIQDILFIQVKKIRFLLRSWLIYNEDCTEIEWIGEMLTICRYEYRVTHVPKEDVSITERIITKAPKIKPAIIDFLIRKHGIKLCTTNAWDEVWVLLLYEQQLCFYLFYYRQLYIFIDVLSYVKRKCMIISLKIARIDSINQIAVLYTFLF